jgi:hypothetical protein
MGRFSTRLIADEFWDGSIETCVLISRSNATATPSHLQRLDLTQDTPSLRSWARKSGRLLSRVAVDFTSGQPSRTVRQPHLVSGHEELAAVLLHPLGVDPEQH